MDASAFNVAKWTHFAAAVMDERGVDAAIQSGHDNSSQLDSSLSLAILAIQSPYLNAPGQPPQRRSHCISHQRRREGGAYVGVLQSVQAKVMLLHSGVSSDYVVARVYS